MNLVDSVDQAAEKALTLLKNPDIARKIGIKGREHVRENFLIISQLGDNLKLYCELLGTAGRVNP